MKAFFSRLMWFSLGMTSCIAQADCNRDVLLYQAVVSMRNKGVPEAKAIFLIPNLTRNTDDETTLRKAVVDVYETFPDAGVVALTDRARKACQAEEQADKAARPELVLQFRGAGSDGSIIGDWSCKGSEDKFAIRTYSVDGSASLNIVSGKLLLKGTYIFDGDHISETYTSKIMDGKASPAQTSGRMRVAMLSTEQAGVVDDTHFLCNRRDKGQEPTLGDLQKIVGSWNCMMPGHADMKSRVRYGADGSYDLFQPLGSIVRGTFKIEGNVLIHNSVTAEYKGEKSPYKDIVKKVFSIGENGTLTIDGKTQCEREQKPVSASK
ncbi:hypothetical protein ACVWYU_000953 [Pseudomonas sp. TE12234]